jgi:hypothetical protein
MAARSAVPVSPQDTGVNPGRPTIESPRADHGIGDQGAEQERAGPGHPEPSTLPDRQDRAPCEEEEGLEAERVQPPWVPAEVEGVPADGVRTWEPRVAGAAPPRCPGRVPAHRRRVPEPRGRPGSPGRSLVAALLLTFLPSPLGWVARQASAGDTSRVGRAESRPRVRLERSRGHRAAPRGGSTMS